MASDKAHVLCVDDEPNILRALNWVLKKDYRVTTAESGQEAIELIREHDFDVIISDQRMPGMMGAEMLREAKKLQPRAMRILLTGYSDMDAIVGSVNDGEVYRFLSKPWQIPELQRVVREAAEIAREDAEHTPYVGDESEGSIDILLIDDDEENIERVRKDIEGLGDLIIARNITEALTALERPNIGVVISELAIDGIDVSRLLKMLKERTPAIATIVLSTRSDSEDVINLINQGQIFRFLFKPIKHGAFKIMVAAALRKYNGLKNNPLLAMRHRVEKINEVDRANLLQDVSRRVREQHNEAGEAQESILERITGGFRRLFH